MINREGLVVERKSRREKRGSIRYTRDSESPVEEKDNQTKSEVCLYAVVFIKIGEGR